MSHHTLLHRLVRPLMPPLARTGVTPNQLTTLRLATGLAAATAFARGGVLWPDLGAATMLVSLLLDRADGELARETGRTSLSGYRYDLASDAVSTIMVFLGMGIGARRALGPASVVYGAVAAVSILALFLLMRVLETETAEGGPVRRPFDPDDALLAAPPLVWAGLMSWTVVIAAVVAPLVAAALGVLAMVSAVRRRRGGSRARLASRRSAR